MFLQAKKSLGQHFLNSPHVLAQIIEAAKLKPGEPVLEIGPGTGVLTKSLLETDAKVVAVEKDSRALSMLEQRFANEVKDGRLSVKEGDILTVDRSTLVVGDKNSPLEDGKYALVANIPYYITGAILETFLETAPRPNRMVLLVQKEVADRICARDAKESILSVSVKAFGTPKLIANVPRGAFTPPPTVESAILAIENITAAPFLEKGLEIRLFFRLLKAGFAHKRKFLKRNLETVVEPAAIDAAWQKLGLDQKVRAEDLTPKQWFDIASVI